MINVGLINNFSNLFTLAKVTKEDLIEEVQKPDPKDPQVIEQYEGECDDCTEEPSRKLCPICGE